MTEQKKAYIGIGSNVGNRKRHIKSALKAISQIKGLRLLNISSLIETKALSHHPQPDFFNTVAEIETDLPVRQLLKQLHCIENQLGRVRAEKWGPRTIDLDMLLFGDDIIEEPELSIPHKQLHLRSFVLSGLNELCPDRLHPAMKVNFGQLYQRLNGCDFVLDSSRPQLISIAGLIGVGKTTLAAGLLKHIPGQGIFEEYDKNPYLAKVYAGQKELALDSELYFLGSSVRQLSHEKLLAGKIYINDYVFQKVLMYAQSWLQPIALKQYKTVYEQQKHKVVSPVLVISIEDTIEHCIERIHRRNRKYEQQIKTSFLKHQQVWYNTFCRNWKTSPLIRIPADQCRTDRQVSRLAQQIRFYLAKAEK